MERAAGRRFLDLMMNMFRQLGMHSTVPDENEPIVYHRCRYLVVMLSSKTCHGGCVISPIRVQVLKKYVSFQMLIHKHNYIYE